MSRTTAASELILLTEKVAELEDNNSRLQGVIDNQKRHYDALLRQFDVHCQVNRDMTKEIVAAIFELGRTHGLKDSDL